MQTYVEKWEIKVIIALLMSQKISEFPDVMNSFSSFVILVVILFSSSSSSAQNVWEDKSGHQLVSSGIITQNSFVFHRDQESEKKTIDELIPLDLVNLFNYNYTLHCEGYEPNFSVKINKNELIYSLNEKNKIGSVSKLISKLGTRNFYFIESSNDIAAFVTENMVNKKIQPSNFCPFQLEKNNNTYFIHEVRVINENKIQLGCCYFDK